jgi:hypothetical protein
MISKTTLALLVFGLISSPVLAAQEKMACKNPRRGYLVTFDDMAKSFHVGVPPGSDTLYKVESVESDKDGLLVKGKTVKGGPGFVAYFGVKKRIEFIDGGQVIQTDPCE